MLYYMANLLILTNSLPCQGLTTQIERACDNARLLSQDLKAEAVERTVSSKSA